MRRRLFNLVAALSLLLCVAACVLWVRGYFRGDRVGYRWAEPGTGAQRDVSLACMAGQFSLTRSRVDLPGLSVEPGWHFEPRYARPGYDMDGGVFGIEHRTVNAPGRWLSEIRVPIWTAALALAVPPALAARNRRRDKLRAAAGRCAACGYDLRASLERCPECGTVVT